MAMQSGDSSSWRPERWPRRSASCGTVGRPTHGPERHRPRLSAAAGGSGGGGSPTPAKSTRGRGAAPGPLRRPGAVTEGHRARAATAAGGGGGGFSARAGTRVPAAMRPGPVAEVTAFDGVVVEQRASAR